jgi:hypothetical protein
MKEEVELKPCPFEHTTKQLERHINLGPQATNEHSEDRDWCVRCPTCNGGTGWHATKKKAVAAWNARSFPSEADKKLLAEIRNAMPRWIYLAAENGEHDSALISRYLDPLIALIERLTQ